MRTLVVGDIHGGLRALEQGLEKVNPKYTDWYIFLGDYVDGWSESAETVAYLIKFSRNYNCIFIRGNHDELTYQFLKNGEENPIWLESGGEGTKKSYRGLSSSEISKHIQFYESLVNFHIDSENRLFVHAGFTNIHGPQHEYYPNMVYWDRTLWEMACAMDKNLTTEDSLYPKRLKLFKEIFIGHTPISKSEVCYPKQFVNVWNIDTGAAFKGSLSIMDIETNEVWQSDPVYTLYPLEKGRN